MTELSSQLADIQLHQSTQMHRVVLRGGFVHSEDREHGDFVGDVALRGDRIEYVGPQAPSADADTTVIDVTGKVVMPGFVDSHIHAWEGAFRGVAPDADFDTYLRLTQSHLVPLMEPDDVVVGERMTAAQSINGGITTIVDCSHNACSPDHSDAAIEALRSTGVRFVHAVSPPLIGGLGAQLPDDLLRLRDTYFHGHDPMQTLRMFNVVPTTESWDFARRHDMGSVSEIGPWVPQLDKLFASGLLGPHHSFNHCVGLTHAQWQTIAEAGVTVNLAPRSDLHFGLGGLPPVLLAQRHHVDVGISSDNEVGYGQDMFTEMRVLLSIQRGLAFQAAAQGDAGAPRPWCADDAIRAATLGGARNAGLDFAVGSLAIGKRADLIVLDLDRVPTRPVGSVTGAIVNFASSANVDTVFVNGVVKKWAGSLVDLDYEALALAAEVSRDKVLARAGISRTDLARTERSPQPNRSAESDE